MNVEKHDNHKFIQQCDIDGLRKIRNITSYNEIVGEFNSEWVEITHDKSSAVNSVPGFVYLIISSVYQVH